MTYEYLQNLKRQNQTIKLLNSDNFAMMVGFFYFIFVEKKYITIKHSMILDLLDDYLYNINLTYKNSYPKSSKEYLDDFVSDKNGYLKKYHTNEDEAVYELTPYTQKTLEFLEGLDGTEFIGSRTKFNIVFELLEELMFETNLSDKERIKILQDQKKEIDAKIQKIEKKEDLRFDNSRIKEHFMLISEQARRLKYDFSQIEYNFRDLNTKAMQKIASSYDSKDSVLDSIFDIEDSIRKSDQGKSFFAFWQVLTDSKKNEQLSLMLENLYKIDSIKELDNQKRLKTLKFDLLNNATKITKVSSKLMEQLRRFLDDRVWVENKKIFDFCKSIEKSAMDIQKDAPNVRKVMTLSNTKVQVNSVFERSLYNIKEDKVFKNELKDTDIKIDIDKIYDIFYIDEEKLKSNINYFLQKDTQITLEQIIKKFPILKGVAELISYISIAKNSQNTLIEATNFIKLTIQDSDNNIKSVLVPNIIFLKGKQ